MRLRPARSAAARESSRRMAGDFSEIFNAEDRDSRTSISDHKAITNDFYIPIKTLSNNNMIYGLNERMSEPKDATRPII
jgi:hypothetical protein